MSGPQPHPVDSAAGETTPLSDAFLLNRGRKRGSYNCGRCGQPKKGHKCNIPKPTAVPTASAAAADNTTPITPIATPSITSTSNYPTIPSPLSAVRPSSPPPAAPVRQTCSSLRRALSFEEVDAGDYYSHDEEVEEDEEDQDLEVEWDVALSGKLPMSCLWEVLRRLPPSSLLAAGMVCKGWRETSRRLWRAAEELRLRVPAGAQIGFVGSVLQKCSMLVRISLRMESVIDATVLACIAFSCPKLESMEILTSDASVNRITGDELTRFVADKRCLTALKMEGCLNLGGLVLNSNSLSTLWLSDLRSLSKMNLNCPKLKEISLDFSWQEKESSDLTSIVESIGRTCPSLQSIHIASLRLSHSAVLALAAADLRQLRMLSLVLGSEITDASVVAIAESYPELQSLDLSGSSISDSGIVVICNKFPDTLSRLLLALCPNITSSMIQFAAAQLPLLEVMDCGMSICSPDSESSSAANNCENSIQRTPPSSNVHAIYQKLIIKHSRLKKLSLWGCSGLDGLYLSCAELNDLNLNSCSNLHPERLQLQCPNLETVHASGCQNELVDTIQAQVTSDIEGCGNNIIPSKRFPDGSKRVQVPQLFSSPQQHLFGPEKKVRRLSKSHCSVLTS